LLFQWSTTATTLIGHYRIVKKLESEKVNLIAEKARLEEEKVGLEADKAKLAAEKAKLEGDKAELLKKLRKVAGANHLEVALKSQQLDEIFNDFIGRVYNIYNPPVPIDPAAESAPSADMIVKKSNQSQYILTSREVLILKGIVAGKENKEIGADIYLVEGTVKNHVTKLFRKFGVQNREELARFVTENGLIERI
jgi:ATP/maltotriose-dependent transcriptional regulator MalT